VPVGPFTASILRSADAGALDRWLKVNGYKMKPDIARYLGPYTARHWFFVALKVTAEQSSVRSATLRVSFATKRPIYPYRTPVSQWGGHDRRPLSLFFLSSFRPQASFVKDGRAWLSPVCETEFDGVPLETLARQLKLRPDSLPGQAVLSLFRTEGGPADYTDDLLFSSDPLLGF